MCEKSSLDGPLERVTITANEVLQKSSQLETDSSTRKIGRSVFFPACTPNCPHVTACYSIR